MKVIFIFGFTDHTLPPLQCSSIFDNKRQDPTGLTALLRSTDLVGVVHTLYCILLHSFVPESASQSQEPYGPGVIQVALQGIRFLNSFAMLDLAAFQVFLINPEYFQLSLFTQSKCLKHLADFPSWLFCTWCLFEHVFCTVDFFFIILHVFYRLTFIVHGLQEEYRYLDINQLVFK